MLATEPTARPVDRTRRTGITRHFTSDHGDPYGDTEWERRTALIANRSDGSVAFEQTDVEFPVSWSQNATNIVAQKYFRGRLGTTARERSVRQVVDRIADTITQWGDDADYFADGDEREAFRAELKFLMVHQRAAFNSPVWFNIGIEGVPQQASACFILSVDDDLASVLDWYREESVIFKGGSGSGVNLSRIRSSAEPLSGGGTASGPISFMRGADASAGAVKSGGTTRRAAKMVILDVGHPDIEEFVEIKAREERKIRVLRDAGFDMSLDGVDSSSVQFQNANNSVRVTDEFMQAVVDDADWELRAITTGEVVHTVAARQLWNRINQAAWECADPGLQFDTTINRWHTAPNAGRITASNPCSEYFHLDDSACNLASLNLLAFLDDHDVFDVEGFSHAVAVMITAQDILVGAADYPTPRITENSNAYRQLGLGFANLGALLMALGLPYDSDHGRAWAASITSLMSATAYATSTRIAARVGAFAGFAKDRQAMLDVLDMHRDAAAAITGTDAVQPDLVAAGRRAWDVTIRDAAECGVRNSQVTVLAPTGTIGFAMDCDTTGIEPDLGLVKTKQLVGGGTMTIANHTIPDALANLGYDAAQVDEIVAYVDEYHSMIGAPHLAAEHLPVFACSMGDNTIHYEGHIRMMAAVQPLLSGGISKTVNLPEYVTVDDVAELHLLAWQLGLKSVAIYRDNCKVGQPLSTSPGRTDGAGDQAAGEIVEQVVHQPVRQKLPRGRRSRTFEFQVADCKGFVTIGEYDDGRPGEIFLTVSKQGSTMAGIMDAFAKAVSYGLQHGVPLPAFIQAFTNMKFEPAGMTDDPDIRFAGSIMDYLFRRLALEYMSYDERAELGIFSVDERIQPTLPGVDEALATSTSTVTPGPAAGPEHSPRVASDAPMCMQCGINMVRAGSCHVCPGCGTTSGCS